MKNRNNMFKIINMIDLLKRKLSIVAFLLFVFTVASYSQEQSDAVNNIHKITGVVRDAKTKEPIFAAIVSTKLQSNSAITDDVGMFELELESLTDVLSVEAFNYGIREVSIKGKTYIEIDMYSDLFTQSYKNVEVFTGEVSNTLLPIGVVEADKVQNTSYFNVDDAIQNQLGGEVRAISRNGNLDNGSNLFIRGLNSIHASSQPLFIVDGVIWNNLNDAPSLHAGFFSNPLSNIDMQDIESISVIKDGTSIYGSKASNGVVLIRTKRGKSDITKITVNAMYGMATEPEEYPVMDAFNTRVLYSELLNDLDPRDKYTSELAFLDDDEERYYYPIYHNETNWSDYIYQTSKTSSMGIEINGGDDIALYNFSVGYTGHKGIVKNTDLNRINTRFNADFNFLDVLNVGMNIALSRIQRNLLDDGIGSANSITHLTNIKSPFLSPYKYTTAGEKTLDYEDFDYFTMNNRLFAVGNPLYIINETYNKNTQWRINIGVTPTVEITPELKFSSNFNFSLDHANEFYYRPLNGSAPSTIYVEGVQAYSLNELRTMYMKDLFFYDDSRFSYSKKINDGAKLDVNLGWRFVRDSYEMDYKNGHNSNRNDTKKIGDFMNISLSGFDTEYKTISNYLTADYNIRNKYIFNASVSMDASSKFGKEAEGSLNLFNQSWGVFPSLSAAWVVSSEEFMKNINFVDRLKLRVGYGITGNDNFNPYLSRTYFTSEKFIDNNADGLVIGNIANEGIKWESTSRINVGVDAAVANERIGVGIDVYSSNTKDLLGLKSFPEYVGKDDYWFNGGEMKNFGLEASLNLKVLNLSNLKWEVSGRLGHYKNEVVTLPDGDYSSYIYGGEVRTSVGNPMGVFYGYKTKGVFSTTEEANDANLYLVDQLGNEHYFGAGDTHFENFNDDDFEINESDKQIIGDPNPDFYGSFSSKISIKRVTLDAYFTYSYGNDVYNAARRSLESGSTFYNQSIRMVNRWKSEGDLTDVPKAEFGDPMGNTRFSDRWIEDGSYIKLKTVSISYDVPIKTNMFEGLTIWASGNNLFTFSKYLGLDPEVSNGQSSLTQGIDSGLLPNLKSFFVGVRIKL